MQPNINACQAVVEAVWTTLGPRGMDKLIVYGNGKATILQKLKVVHPAAKTLVDIARSQHAEVGDGTASVVIFAGEFLKKAKTLVEEGVHPRLMSKAYRKSLQLAPPQGKDQVISNINACQAVVEAVWTTLGQRGMDKLIVYGNGKATIQQKLEVVHPAAKTLVDIARSQHAEVGDGTASVVIFAGEFLKNAKTLVEEGVHPRLMSKAYRKSLQLAPAQGKGLL